MLEATEAELEVMRCVWNQEVPTSASVSQVLGQSQGWSVSTTKTLLKRLVDKGYLSTELEGKAYIYRPLIDEIDAVSFHFEQLSHSFCEKKIGKALAHVLDTVALSFEDRDLLIQLLQDKACVYQVQCSCATGSMCHCAPTQKKEV